MSLQTGLVVALSVTLAIITYIVFAGTSASPHTLPLRKQCQSVCTRLIKLGRSLCIRVLRQGPVPKHVAFIMDGNRRYARKSQQAVTSGHVAGFHKLANVLEWCAELGIRHVSVFAFAINNFNRSEEEVSALMNLAKDKLKVLSERSDLVLRYNGRIRVVGNRALLSADVLEAIEQAEEKTRENKGITLNVCFPYSSTFEISEAVRSVVKDVENGRLEVSQIDEKALESRLQIPGPDLDILVRTSGQIRFSNYMLWQSSKMAYIQFVDAYWPDFSLMHMLRIILSWQQSSWIISLRKKNMDSHRAPQQTPHTLVSDDGTCCSEQDATQ